MNGNNSQNVDVGVWFGVLKTAHDTLAASSASTPKVTL